MNRNQRCMIDSMSSTSARRMRALRALRTDYVELQAQFADEHQAAEDLAAANWELRQQVERLTSERIENYARGLHQGHHDAYANNLPLCPECGNHAAVFVHKSGYPCDYWSE